MVGSTPAPFRQNSLLKEVEMGDLMKKPDQTARAHIFVSGRVQGVFYRARTRETALAHGLTGWVRNCADGRVEVLMEGEKENVTRVISWCRQGPPAAYVADVETLWEEPTGEFFDFTIKY